jgi:predicted esterase
LASRAAWLSRLAAIVALMAAPGPSLADGLLPDVTFTDPAPLASNAELARRLLSPLTVDRLGQALARSGKALRDQPLDLAAERFAVYVPQKPAPPQGFGLLVFVSPWDEARLPSGWAGVLDRYGLIFVSAAHSGNDQNILGRRAPLAVTAAQNIMRRYAIDLRRVYVAGFSGGSRTAMRLALGYPDLFHGALLMAGADPVGEATVSPPPRDLFSRFQSETRLVYLTGEADTISLSADGDSIRSMHGFCVTNIKAIQVEQMGHEVASDSVFEQGLKGLIEATPPDSLKLASCRAALDRRLEAQFQPVEALLAKGDPGAAQRLLAEIDRRWGGLAAPRVVELSRRAAQP